jgi:hypothetical protein
MIRQLPIIALLCAGVTFAPAAHAQHHHGGHGGDRHAAHGGLHHGGHRGGGAGAAILGGMIGLGLGAAIAGSSQPYYAPPPYGYAAPGYYYPPPAPGYYAPMPTYDPSAGGDSANDLNRQELYRLQAAPY